MLTITRRDDGKLVVCRWSEHLGDVRVGFVHVVDGKGVMLDTFGCHPDVWSAEDLRHIAEAVDREREESLPPESDWLLVAKWVAGLLLTASALVGIVAAIHHAVVS